MIEKKSAKDALSGKKTTFLLIGFVFVLAMVYDGFELFASKPKTEIISIEDADKNEAVTEYEPIDIVETEPDTTPPVRFAEKLPEFPGGREKLYEMLNNELQYPESARAAKIQGTVVIEVIIEKNGSISNPKVLYSLSPDCDQEAIRALLKLPKWKPAEQMGKPVRCCYTIPIKFTLQ
jgi:protein TonB